MTKRKAEAEDALKARAKLTDADDASQKKESLSPTAAPQTAPKAASKRTRTAKSEAAALSEAIAAAVTDTGDDVVLPEAGIVKSTKGKRGAKATKAVTAAKEGGDEDSKEADDEVAEKPKAKRAKKPQPAELCPQYTVDMRAAPCEVPALRVISWNVAGLRGMLKKEPAAIPKLIAAENPDVICLQETKISDKNISECITQLGLPSTWHMYWNCSEKAGYAGTAIICKEKALSVEKGVGIVEHDGEGRTLTVELPDVYVVNVYVPNSGEGLKRLDYRVNEFDVALSSYVKELERKKPVVLTGDLNCAHTEIDIHDPKGNERSAGFTKEERESFQKCYLDNGFIDTFRQQHPGVCGFTYYSYRFNMRAKNKGWRLDYFLVSKALGVQVHDSYLLKEVTGSDHVPLGLILRK